MSGAEASATNTSAHTTDTPQVLLEHHLKELRLPTILREYDKVARIVHALGGTLPRHFVVLAQESRQPQLLQVMFQQHLRRVGGVRVSLTAHGVTPPTDVSEAAMVGAESSVM